jgi:Uma2 family endonuclease
MTPTLTKPRPPMTVADLYKRFGPIPLSRIRFDPEPGTATEKDVLRINDHENCLCELVDGILVEKAMGYPESFLAAALIIYLGQWVRPRKLGKVSAPDGTLRFRPGLVRMPDVAFVSWARMPKRRAPTKQIPDLIPDLAVEILSPSNTRREMANKLREYFRAGVRLVWYVDPETRTVAVYTSPKRCVTLTAEQTLDGGEVLPGFTLPLHELFAELDEEAPPATK